jgi:seryl-tRNA synthetase
MLVKLEEIVKSKKSFDMLMGKSGIPLKQAYSLSKTHRKVQKECDVFEKVRNEKIKEIGKVTEAGNYQIAKEDMPQLEKDVQELLDVEVDIAVEPINIDVFVNCDLEPIIFADLHWLMSDVDSV